MKVRIFFVILALLLLSTCLYGQDRNRNVNQAFGQIESNRWKNVL